MTCPRKLWNLITFKSPDTALHVFNNHTLTKTPALLFRSLTFSVAHSTDSLHPVQRSLFFSLHVMLFSFIKFCFFLPLHAIWPEVMSNFFSMPPVIWNRLVIIFLLLWLSISFQVSVEKYSLFPYFCLPTLIYLRSYISCFCKVVERWTLHDGQNSKT